MNKKLKYSIVVPLYNEAANVTPLYVRLTEIMEGLDEPYEIILIDDGCRRNTTDTLRNLGKRYSSQSHHAAPELRSDPGSESGL